MQLQPGATVGPLELDALDGVTVSVPDPRRLVHLQFRRFAGCPICNVHLRSVITRHDEIAEAGIREVALFHSTAEEMRTYVGDMPFAVVADPEKVLYGRFGVESGVRALVDVRGIAPVLRALVTRSTSVKLQPTAGVPTHPNGGRSGLPADILIDASGTVVAAKYGKHAADQWSVDELLQHAAGRR